MDLIKVYDRVDWSFMRFVMFQTELPVEVVNWIVASVTSANFSILINGIPIVSFNGNRGLQQGFPLSMLLFLLIIEGLILLINLAKSRKLIQGI